MGLPLDLSTDELRDQVRNFRKVFNEVAELSALRNFDPRLAYTLYIKLFAPVEAHLQGASRIYIAADDVPYSVPFEALVDLPVIDELFPKEGNLDRNSMKSLVPLDEAAAEEAANAAKAKERARRESISKAGIRTYLGEYATLHYLLDRYTFSYLPSASILRSLREYQKPGYGQWRKPLVAFADPIFGSEKERTEPQGSKMATEAGQNQETVITTALLTRSAGGQLVRLEESAEEAEAIRREVQGQPLDVYKREAASEENVYQAELKAARYLLFSTHGLLGGDFSGVEEPALALTQVSNPPGRDGFLTMSEVLGLDLNAELTVLSACDTWGRSEQASKGEGFAGLTRSFMYAGSRGLLVTHWKVESQAARDLMVRMFELRRTMNFPEALRKAKVQLKSATRSRSDVPHGNLSLAHPFFWAPFVLVGEN